MSDDHKSLQQIIDFRLEKLNKLREDVLFTLNRGGGSMQINESGDDRRHSQRLDLSFEISVLNQKGKTINVCEIGRAHV